MGDDVGPVEPSPALLAAIKMVRAKRPRTVIDHILKHGFITTDDLKEQYGYNHPPRAARDVREAGIPLVTTSVKGPDGRNIAAYRFPTAEAEILSRAGGRRAFPKAFKESLLDHYGARCNLCGTKMPGRALQIDHRVPYEIAGDDPGVALDIEEYMLVCGSCNRSKSWTCEHCPNWQEADLTVCNTCAWARPEAYTHVATEQQRRLTVVWQGAETREYDAIRRAAEERRQEISDYVKDRLRRKS